MKSLKDKSNVSDGRKNNKNVLIICLAAALLIVSVCVAVFILMRKSYSNDTAVTTDATEQVAQLIDDILVYDPETETAAIITDETEDFSYTEAEPADITDIAYNTEPETAISHNDETKKEETTAKTDIVTERNNIYAPETTQPLTRAPKTKPPVTTPPITTPPITTPPITTPPITTPPVTNPPVTDPPVTESVTTSKPKEPETTAHVHTSACMKYVVDVPYKAAEYEETKVIVTPYVPAEYGEIRYQVKDYTYKIVFYADINSLTFDSTEAFEKWVSDIGAEINNNINSGKVRLNDRSYIFDIKKSSYYVTKYEWGVIKEEQQEVSYIKKVLVSPEQQEEGHYEYICGY